MAQSRKYKRVTVKTNTTDRIAELESFMTDLGIAKISAKVWSEIEYAIYVEFGTSKMAPRAMIRRAIPDIEAYFQQRWGEMKSFPPTKEEVRAVFNDSIEYAKQVISGNTPVKTGALKGSWTVQKARFYKAKEN